ncbi:PAK4-inhibitor INKA2 isoform X2 [Narcine bancroftii]|uniref:PAK4-inhibitor INKA2 isoform X2 n=1 Tax=Narcine bancroftii TaxID=1343680 RepID=UPI00383229B5
MDNSLRRLKQELQSMKEAGDGLQDQMNCMMGTLQELKLLQVQTALEQLEISGVQSQPPSIIPQQPRLRNGKEESKIRQCWLSTRLEGKSNNRPSSDTISAPSLVALHGLTNQPKSTSGGYPKEAPHQEGQMLATSSVAFDHLKDGPASPSVVFSQQCSGFAPAGAHQHPVASNPVGRTTQDSEGSDDWTSSLLSQSRNRQPLILGDNVFADLVGNWLDLPELEKMSQAAPMEGRDRRNHVPILSKSQEFQKKLTLTANIFKKLLRSVRPDKGKRAQAPTSNPSETIAKRSSKVSKQKVTFYFALRGNGTPNSRPLDSSGSGTIAQEECKHSSNACTRKLIQPMTGKHSQFDYNTVVWV